MKRFVMMFILVLTSVSCGKQVSELWPEATTQEAYADPAVTELYTYEFNGSSCYTGKQAAQTFENICSQLKDHELNENCAYEEREELFLSAGCPGVF